MAYNKINWTENTPITADRLNQMETGIADASKDIANCLSSDSPSFTGNMVQTRSGYSWIYHINADIGSLNLAPQDASGNSEWDNQIYMKRDGSLYCNHGCRVITGDCESFPHYKLRYGSGLGGQDGYITFSW